MLNKWTWNQEVGITHRSSYFDLKSAKAKKHSHNWHTAMKAVEAQSETKVAIKSIRLGWEPILMTIPPARSIYFNNRFKPQQIKKCRSRQPGLNITSTFNLFSTLEV